MRRVVPYDLADLVGTIYEAALSSDWTEPFERTRRMTGVAAMGIKVETPRGMVQTWVGLPEGFERAFAEHYWRLDPWTQGSKRWQPGTCLVSSELVSDEELRASEFYNDLCVPHGLVDAIGGCVERDGERYVTFGMMRSRGAHGDGRREAALVQPLFAHFRRAVRLGIEMHGLKAEVRSLRQAMDGVRVGVLVVDAERRILYANAAAVVVLRRGDGVRDVGGALTFRDAGAAAALAAAVGRRSADAPIVLRIGRALGARPYGVVVTPCHRRILEAVPNGQPTAVLYVFDPEARPTPSPAMLRRLFGLTTTETEVALRLTAGRTASQVAADLGTSLATVRTHLRQLFDKTGTSRQAALVSLLVSLGAAGGE